MSFVVGVNVPDTFQRRVAATPNKTAIMRKREGAWKHVTWREYGDRVFEIARALKSLGLRKGDRVALLSQTRPEWTYLDQAILSLGGITVPVYPSVTGEEVGYILRDSGARFVFCDDASQVDKTLPFKAGLPDLERVFSIERTGREGVVGLDEFLASSEFSAQQTAVERQAWRADAATLRESDLASIVYTSGTSGVPKGACITHGNFLAVMANAAAAMSVSDEDLTLLFLPVAHILGRIEQMITLSAGWTNAYCESLATLMDNLAEMRPTVLISVPRIYEKVYQGLQKKAQSGGWVERQAVQLAFRVASEMGEARRTGRTPSIATRLEHVAADKLVFAPLRARFGGRMRFAISGGAPLSREIADFFAASGMNILEGYGLTETTGPVAFNTIAAVKPGTVGRPWPGSEVKIAADGEILLRGPSVFAGYFNNPEGTREALQVGWFATGDVGDIDADGFIRITDRKKDLLITAGGKNVAPQKIEGLLRQDPIISNALVVGDRRNYLVSLITLAPDELRRVVSVQGWSDLKGVEAAATDTRLQGYLKVRIQRVNAGLAPYETIKRFRILPRDFSMEAGELTPSLKVKRKFCSQKYAKIIDEMYDPAREGKTP